MIFSIGLSTKSIHLNLNLYFHFISLCWITTQFSKAPFEHKLLWWNRQDHDVHDELLLIKQFMLLFHYLPLCIKVNLPAFPTSLATLNEKSRSEHFFGIWFKRCHQVLDLEFPNRSLCLFLHDKWLCLASLLAGLILACDVMCWHDMDWVWLSLCSILPYPCILLYLCVAQYTTIVCRIMNQNQYKYNSIHRDM